MKHGVVDRAIKEGQILFIPLAPHLVMESSFRVKVGRQDLCKSKVGRKLFGGVLLWVSHRIRINGSTR